MMKLWAPFLAVSLLLNAYTLWRVQDAIESRDNDSFPSNCDSSCRISFDETEINKDTVGRHLVDNILNLELKIDDLSKQILALEAESAGDELRAAADVNFQDSARSAMSIVSDRLAVKSNDEEWFWNDSDGDDAEDAERISASLGVTESLDIHSVNCRSGWCRVEIEEYPTPEEDVDSSGELHLKINESVGRDTTIRWGKQEGNRRVVFVK